MIRWEDRLLDRFTLEDGDDTKKMIESLHCYIICIFTTAYSPSLNDQHVLFECRVFDTEPPDILDASSSPQEQP
jgi:hypothetical protein